MSQGDLVKVVITSYNRRAWLQAAVESVVAQTYRPLHVVIVDDVSPDGAGEWAREYAASRPDLVTAVVKEVNGGVADTIRVGLRSGPAAPYVALLNDDDLWYPQKLELQVGRLQADPSVRAVCCEAEIIDGNGRATQELFSDRYGFFGTGDLTDLVRGNHACASTLVTTADVAREVAASLPDESLVWDYYLLLTAAARGSVSWIDQPLAAFRESDSGQHTGNDDLMWRQTTIARQTWLESDPLASRSARSLVALATADVAARQLSARKPEEFLWHTRRLLRLREPQAVGRLGRKMLGAGWRALGRALNRGRGA